MITRYELLKHFILNSPSGYYTKLHEGDTKDHREIFVILAVTGCEKRPRFSPLFQFQARTLEKSKLFCRTFFILLIHAKYVQKLLPHFKQAIPEMRPLFTRLIFSIFLLLPLIANAQNFESDSHKATSEIINRPQNFYHSNGAFLIGFEILPGDQTTSPRFRIGYNRRLTPNLYGGIGVGFTYYNDPLSLLPVFITLKYRLLQASVFPFISLKTGYNFSFVTAKNTSADNHKGGLLFNPAIGIQFTLKKGIALYFSGGYNIDHASFGHGRKGVRTVATDITYRRFMAGVGLIF